MLYLDSLNQSLHKILDNDKNVIIIGEDILDPYGGAFKVTKGLSTSFPNQIISTPISEAAIVGSAVGMAMRGLKPIVEIMFGDFITLAADQIINHASKYNWMYNEKVNVPMLIRLPVGGGRGYGPTHSQSLESIFMSIPGIEIISPSLYHDPGKMLLSIMKNITNPIFFIEYKLDYAREIKDDNEGNFHIIKDDVDKYNQNLIITLYPSEIPDITIITYGGNVSIATKAAEKLFIETEILTNVLALSSVKPIDTSWLIDKLENSNKIIILEEGNKIGGWGAEVSAILNEALNDLDLRIKRLGAYDNPIPSSAPMEREVLPSVDRIIKMIKEIVD